MSKYDSQFLKLSDVGTVGRGKSKHRPRNDSSLYGGKYPFIQTGDVKSSNFYIDLAPIKWTVNLGSFGVI
jgi:type I restriction enzyme, S subunit